MSNEVILLIDDSATIRRLVDTELSSAGYQVLLAPTAEEGVQQAQHEQPDLIILDHQLPGTTGYSVCCQLLQDESMAKIPVVISSTLRKKAYSEYLDCDNVVDMLPKPYSPQVLQATVQNALDTATLVVQSQTDGSAVPEVIQELGESDLAGTFACFSLREVIDWINNGKKRGVLEITAREFRISIYTSEGRIQAVTGAGINTEEFASRIPESLTELAPVVKLTVTENRGSELDGLVELLNNKVLDPRLLRKLLRFQAGELLCLAFAAETISFRFDTQRKCPPLFQKLPLESSLVALLVEARTNTDELESEEIGFVRQAMRGQCLDRSGLAPRHLQLMKVVAEPITIPQAANQLQWSAAETAQVMRGFELADFVERAPVHAKKVIYCVSEDLEFRRLVGQSLHHKQNEVQLKTVSDFLALGLLLRRQTPATVWVDLKDEHTWQKFVRFRTGSPVNLSDSTWLASCDAGLELDQETMQKHGFAAVFPRTLESAQLAEALLGNPPAAEETHVATPNVEAAPAQIATPTAQEN